MKESSDGFVRADQIGLKSLDEQLERHLNKVLTLDKTKMRVGGDQDMPSSAANNLNSLNLSTTTAASSAATSTSGMTLSIPKRHRQEWEIDLSTLIIDVNSFNLSTTAAASSAATSTSGMTLSIPKRHRQEWEIDPSKLIINNIIARGTIGTVHRGVYDGQDVAVKLLDWGEEGNWMDVEIAYLRAAFTQEVDVWHKLDHPNVTKFIGATIGSSELQIQTENGQIGMPSNIYCVVVEYLPGGALKSHLIRNRRRKLAFKVVVQLALDLARGLSYLHSQKIVHRDVKTESMLLDKTHTVKIANFGVARVEASNPKDMTRETGTRGYMAPEVLNGNPYNRKCDVYSFGICLWEIYCCDMPYPDLSFSEEASAVVHRNLRPHIPRCCPRALANVMKRCWDANPDKRPEMDEVVSMIEAIDTTKGGGMIPQDQSQCCLCFCKKRGP